FKGFTKAYESSSAAMASMLASSLPVLWTPRFAYTSLAPMVGPGQKPQHLLFGSGPRRSARISLFVCLLNVVVRYACLGTFLYGSGSTKLSGARSVTLFCVTRSHL